MVDAVSYPQVPSNVWWGMRALLKRRPSIKVDDMLVASDLGVQIVAARQYLKELKRAGILDDEGRPTEVAHKWRNDETYLEAVDDIVRGLYPDSLVTVAPPGAADRSKVVSWFTHQGLGTGAAGNKAATYLLISAREPLDLNSAPSKNKSSSSAKGESQANPATTNLTKTPKASAKADRRENSIPLNVNVQVHISADSSNDQIESIFRSMRRYLYDDQSS